jgi:chitinase
MKKRTMRTVPFMIICWVFVTADIPVFAGDGLSEQTAAFRIAGYLPEYRAADFDPAAFRQLTDLILFSASPSPEGGLDMTRLKKTMPWGRLRAFKTKELVRLILCVGGWERSAHFAAIAGSAQKRHQFVQAALKVCRDERLDSLDLDWEHPKDATEQQGYETLLAELHNAFKPFGLVLSAAVAGWQKLSGDAIAAVDRVNVMAYDNNGRHATFEAACADVKALTDMGVPPHKINLGLPFYGRDIAQREKSATYREIAAKHRRLPPEVDEVDNLYFNGPSTIRRKTQWAVQSQLGGVMVWELGQDAAGDKSLLKVIRDTVDRARK